MPFTDEHKQEIERKIVNRIIYSLNNEQLKEENLPDIASKVLARIDAITNQDELAEFLTELSVQWPIFENILEIELGRVKSELEKKIARDVLHLANSGNIEEAIRLAKSMTETHV